MVIAFDFDSTLSDDRIQMLAKKMRTGNELWVVTARSDNDFNRGVLKPVLNKLGLTEYNVIFCNEKPKEYLKVLMRIFTLTIYQMNLKQY